MEELRLPRSSRLDGDAGQHRYRWHQQQYLRPGPLGGHHHALQSGWQVQKVFGTQGEGPGQFGVPAAISLDRQGNVYVADWGNHRIQKFSPDGAVLGMFGTDGNGPRQIHLPSGIAVDRDGNMYVSDSDNWRMIKFAPDDTQSTRSQRVQPRVTACSTERTLANFSTTTASSSTARVICTLPTAATTASSGESLSKW